MGEFGMIPEYESSLQNVGFQLIDESGKVGKTREKRPDLVLGEAAFPHGVR